MKVAVAHRLDGVGEYYFSQKLREIDALNKTGDTVINLGIGSPDLPPHPDVIKTLKEESVKHHTHAYQGYKGVITLRKEICNWYKRWYGVDLNPDSEVLPLIGSKEGIMHICMTYVNPGDFVLVPNPGYPTYSSAAQLAGGKVVEYKLKEENNWFPDLVNIEKQLESLKSEHRTAGHSPKGGLGGLMFVNYPHMPTGQQPTTLFFQQLVAFAKKNKLLLVHDNPYSFILNDAPMSLLSVEGAKDCVIELNSLSKSHNMAGWRVGMLCGAKDRIDEVLRFKSNMDSGMFLPVQLAAAKAMALDDIWYKDLNSIYNKRREKVYQLLNVLNCNFNKNQVGLFVWAKISMDYKDGYELSDKILNEARVFITPGGIFGSEGSGYVRISLCNTEEKFEEALKRIQNISILKRP